MMKGLNATLHATIISCKQKIKSKVEKHARVAAEEKCGEILQFIWGNGARTTGYPYGKMDFDLYLTSYTKINSR